MTRRARDEEEAGSDLAEGELRVEEAKSDNGGEQEPAAETSKSPKNGAETRNVSSPPE